MAVITIFVFEEPDGKKILSAYTTPLSRYNFSELGGVPVSDLIDTVSPDELKDLVEYEIQSMENEAKISGYRPAYAWAMFGFKDYTDEAVEQDPDYYDWDDGLDQFYWERDHKEIIDWKVGE